MCVCVCVCVCVCARVCLNRLKGEFEEKNEMWLSCQRRCDTAERQLSSLQQREEEINRNRCAAEEEAVRLKEVVEKVQQETGELRREMLWLWYRLCSAYIDIYFNILLFIWFLSCSYRLGHKQICLRGPWYLCQLPTMWEKVIHFHISLLC